MYSMPTLEPDPLSARLPPRGDEQGWVGAFLFLAVWNKLSACRAGERVYLSASVTKASRP